MSGFWNISVIVRGGQWVNLSQHLFNLVNIGIQNYNKIDGNGGRDITQMGELRHFLASSNPYVWKALIY